MVQETSVGSEKPGRALVQHVERGPNVQLRVEGMHGRELVVRRGDRVRGAERDVAAERVLDVLVNFHDVEMRQLVQGAVVDDSDDVLVLVHATEHGDEVFGGLFFVLPGIVRADELLVRLRALTAGDFRCTTIRGHRA